MRGDSHLTSTRKKAQRIQSPKKFKGVALSDDADEAKIRISFDGEIFIQACNKRPNWRATTAWATVRKLASGVYYEGESTQIRVEQKVCKWIATVGDNPFRAKRHPGGPSVETSSTRGKNYRPNCDNFKLPTCSSKRELAAEQKSKIARQLHVNRATIGRDIAALRESGWDRRRPTERRARFTAIMNQLAYGPRLRSAHWHARKGQ